MRKNHIHKLVIVSLLLAMAILLQMVEPGLPLPVPGVKLGLANIIGLITLFLLDYKSMLVVNIARVFLASLLRGTIFGTAFFLSLSGVMLCTIMVIILKRSTKLSIIGLSIASSVFHCLGQILAVSFIYDTIYIISYLPVMWVLSIPTGIMTGIISRLVVQRIGKKEV